MFTQLCIYIMILSYQINRRSPYQQSISGQKKTILVFTVACQTKTG